MLFSRPSSSFSDSVRISQPLRVSDRGEQAIGRIVLAVPALFILLGSLLEKQWPFLPYFVTEWMITYSAGFVRRGLVGQTFWLLGNFAHVSPIVLIEAARFSLAVAFAFLMGGLVLKMRPALGTIGGLVLLTNPYVCFYLWCEPGSLDLLFVFITAYHLRLAKLSPEQYLRGSVLLFGIAGVLLALSHEALLFICLPVNAIICVRTVQSQKVKALCAIFSLPAIACLVAFHFHGTPAQAKAIWSQWDALGMHPPFSIGFEQLGLSLPEEIRRAWADFTSRRLAVWVLDTVFCFAPLAAICLRLTGGPKMKQIVVDYFLLPLAAAIPLYIVGTDWDRWLAILCVTGVVGVLIAAPTDSPRPSSRRLQFALAAIVFATLFVRLATPFMPEKRAIAGPLTRAAEYFSGQMPT